MYTKLIIAFIASSPAFFGAAVNFTRPLPVVSQPEVVNATTTQAAALDAEVSVDLACSCTGLSCRAKEHRVTLRLAKLLEDVCRVSLDLHAEY